MAPDSPEPQSKLDELKSRLRHARAQVEELQTKVDVLEHEQDVLKRRNECLRDELTRLDGLRKNEKAKLLEPVGGLLEDVKDIDQARSLLAELSTRIAESLEQRELLLDYVLEKAPDAPEKADRARVEETGRTGHSWIGRLRIGKKDKVRFCKECGSPSKDYCSAHLFLGFYGDGRLGELFLKLDRRHANTITGGGYHLAAKFGSLALQHGATEATVIKQMRYQKDGSAGRPWGPDGPRKDITGVSSLTDYIGVTIERVLAERDKEREALAAAQVAEVERAEKPAEQPTAAAPEALEPVPGSEETKG